LIKEIFRKREILGSICVRAFGLRFCAGGALSCKREMPFRLALSCALVKFKIHINGCCHACIQEGLPCLGTKTIFSLNGSSAARVEAALL
jgi:hypothetical protein